MMRFPKMNVHDIATGAATASTIATKVMLDIQRRSDCLAPQQQRDELAHVADVIGLALRFYTNYCLEDWPAFITGTQGHVVYVNFPCWTAAVSVTMSRLLPHMNTMIDKLHGAEELGSEDFSPRPAESAVVFDGAVIGELGGVFTEVNDFFTFGLDRADGRTFHVTHAPGVMMEDEDGNTTTTTVCLVVKVDVGNPGAAAAYGAFKQACFPFSKRFLGEPKPVKNVPWLQCIKVFGPVAHPVKIGRLMREHDSAPSSSSKKNKKTFATVHEAADAAMLVPLPLDLGYSPFETALLESELREKKRCARETRAKAMQTSSPADVHRSSTKTTA